MSRRSWSWLRRSDQPWGQSFRLYVWLGVVIVVIRVAFRILFGGYDGGPVLLDLPEIPLPDWVDGHHACSGRSPGGAALRRCTTASGWRPS